MYNWTVLETIDYHRSMLANKVRMQSYLRAILKAVLPGDVVLEVGSVEQALGQVQLISNTYCVEEQTADPVLPYLADENVRMEVLQ